MPMATLSFSLMHNNHTNQSHTIMEAYQISPFQVLRSNAGYYIGRTYFDVELEADLPWSRDSYGYYATSEEATKALQWWKDNDDPSA